MSELQEPISHLRYPWQRDYFDAVLETDDRKLAAKVDIAQNAIQRRLAALTADPNGSEERHEIAKVLKALQVLREERLGS